MATWKLLDCRKANGTRRHVKQHTTKLARRWTLTNTHYTDEDHSLQGKTGKTHAVC